MPGLYMPPPSVQGASSHGQEGKNMPAPPPAADPSDSNEVRENPSVSTGDQGISDSSSTSVEKKSPPKDDRPLGALGPQMGDKSKRGYLKNNPPPGDERPKGGGKDHQKPPPKGGLPPIRNNYQYVKSRISYN